MSDRMQVLHQIGHCHGEVRLFMDGESGTWRLFIEPGSACIDFTLSQLVAVSRSLSSVIADIDRDPESFNAERRKAHFDA